MYRMCRVDFLSFNSILLLPSIPNVIVNAQAQMSLIDFQVTFADAHKARRNEGTVEFASRRDMEVGHGHFLWYELKDNQLL